MFGLQCLHIKYYNASGQGIVQQGHQSIHWQSR